MGKKNKTKVVDQAIVGDMIESVVNEAKTNTPVEIVTENENAVEPENQQPNETTVEEKTDTVDVIEPEENIDKTIVETVESTETVMNGEETVELTNPVLIVEDANVEVAIETPTVEDNVENESQNVAEEIEEQKQEEPKPAKRRRTMRDTYGYDFFGMIFD